MFTFVTVAGEVVIVKGLDSERKWLRFIDVRDGDLISWMDGLVGDEDEGVIDIDAWTIDACGVGATAVICATSDPVITRSLDKLLLKGLRCRS